MSSGPDRLTARPGELINRDRRIGFHFDGKRYDAYQGDTVASALAAAGVRAFSRSFKYHRPRGLLCCAGRCPNCMVEVDGIPNVRACTETARDGMHVRGQNAWPSVRSDALAVFDRFDRLLPVGFYYKTFIRPRWLWPLYEGVLRRLAGLGRINSESRPELHPRKRHLHCDVTIIGGGPAGCLAALEAAAAGSRVVLVDDQPRLGGHLRLQAASTSGDDRIAGRSGIQAAAKLASLVASRPEIEHLSNATAFGLYEGGLIGVSQGNTLVRIRARQIVIATGAAENPLLFENNDLPGVMLGTGALRLAQLYGVKPGTSAVLLTDDDHGWRVALELIDAGIPVSALVDRRSDEPEAELTRLVREKGVAIHLGGRAVRAQGRGKVNGVIVVSNGRRQRLPCDLLLMSGRPEPVFSLALHDGSKPRFDEQLDAFVPPAETAGIRVAGHANGLLDEAAVPPSRRRPEPAEGGGGLEAPSSGRRDLDGGASGEAGSTGRKSFVCVCEDVTAKDVGGAIREGFDALETLKRYSTVTMGPCQGKMCHALSARLHAALTDQSVGVTGLTTARPPFQPVTLAALAGPHLSPYRQTAMNDRHAAAGATWMDMGEWKRPFMYSTVEKECQAVREAAGIIDVSTLGKLLVRGVDSGEFLDWLHPNRFSDLRIGRVRYRAMCDDAGIVLDDGTIARLGEDRFFVTTGTGTLDAVEQWLTWWLAGSEREVTVTNLTSEYAAVNLAGPRARDVMGRLTSMDVSPKGMPYLSAIEGPVAGVPAIILRIGFVGELGYEVHVPADYGAHLWDALLEAGRDFGLEPFGVETQRVLRLEKQHLIPGQDTDALSNPLEAGLDWIVKSEKPDFIGRDALARVSANGRRNLLVGFEIVGDGIPAEGAAIVDGGRPIGRVTSCKWSPALRKAVGLAWVPASNAVPGAELVIRLGVGTDGKTTRGRVHPEPFYDAPGARLRS
ncbi:MAG: (2Fe-2S)-binding protein [Chloroflexi bacterium]|nr:(2Fe-2S)-binding protein [Chloroflexota bacterium]